VADDPYKYFRVEARELVERLGQGALELEKGAGSPEIVRSLLRSAHTLKGAARVVKQREIADAAHAIEDALAPFREATDRIPLPSLNAILKLLDEIETRIAALTPATTPPPSLTRRAFGEPAHTVRAAVAEMDALLDGMTEASVQLAAVHGTAPHLDRARHLAQMLTEQLGVPSVRSGPSDMDGAPAMKTRALATELLSLVTRIERTVTRGVQQVDQELRQAHHIAARLRLLPVDSVFGVLERTARDVAQAMGKRVAFRGDGGEVRLDAHVLDILQGAFVQLVRNGVAHGIEAEPARLAAGKPPDGQICVEVVRRGNRVEFHVRDDGMGVNVEAVHHAAQRKGLLPPGAERLSSGELLPLLLKGGISTSGVVDEIAGRGIGLDVVREAAERLGGEVRIETAAGEGTVVALAVPVSLSSMGVLLVEGEGVRAAIPLDTVRNAFRIDAGQVARSAEGETVLFQGEAVPYFSLARVLRRQGPVHQSISSWSVVIVEGGDGLAAVGVDRLLGTTTMVVRALSALTPSDPIIAGVALDAAGDPGMVLDAKGLAAYARRAHDPESVVPHARRPVLVIDDSPTTRMLEQSILETAGFETDVATSAEEALVKARHRTYGLFLVDVEMPGMDGFAFVEHTRSDPALRNIPAILVTSRDSPEDRRRGMEAGARAYIVKSEFDQTDFLERVRRFAA
jgi:two-component system chemotaxis sensor kinase CheA